MVAPVARLPHMKSYVYTCQAQVTGQPLAFYRSWVSDRWPCLPQELNH